ncbi:hypothetical protein F5884DRAFT_874831 [Xylogone sp. PMI_703]|nr:hypothetical protein F5884DRAFT_874831 [Xylogone sp. PMI_703]
MSASIPKTTKAWIVNPTGDFDALKLNLDFPIPALSNNDVLVRFHAASLNYRDLIMAKGFYTFGMKENVVAGSDGVGEVIAVGSNVTRFKASDRVAAIFNQGHISGPISPEIMRTSLGSLNDGTLRQYGVFNENGLVEIPSGLTWEEAATLPCAAVTAWNALYGTKPLIPGDVVLTQGTGGVSIFAAQFAKAAGATVIVTTGSPDKAEALKKLGVDHVINYKDDPSWGETAKALSPKGRGVNHVIELGGPGTIAQSLKAIKMGGIISIIGFLDTEGGEQPSFLEALKNSCIISGVVVGSRAQFEEMNRAIDANNIKPPVDPKIFAFDQLKEAYQYVWDQKHFGKVVVKIG